MRIVAIVVLSAIAIIASLLLYSSRDTHIVLYTHGTLEVPQGRIFTVFNPFRDQTSERTAEKLIADLRTGRCESIVRQLNREQDYDPRICPVMFGTSRQRLVWRKDGEFAKMIVYAIPERQARVWIGFRRDEPGFMVSSVSLVR